MKRPRLRITLRRLMVAVFLVAIDFAIVRSLSRTHVDIGVAFVTLPMANTLILVAAGVWNGSERRPFWIGFEITGWFITILFGYLSWSHGATFFWPANSVYPWETIKDQTIQTLYLFSIDLIVYLPPQLLVAWLGGRVVDKWFHARVRRARPRSSH